MNHVTGAKRGKTRRDWCEFHSLIGGENGTRFFNQSKSEIKQNQSKARTTFDTQLKIASFNN